MAIAPSKLGRLIADTVGFRVDQSTPATLHMALRAQGLLDANTSAADLEAAIGRVRSEFNYADPFNSPNERLREHLRPHLSTKGVAWAEPLRSLDLPDDEPI